MMSPMTAGNANPLGNKPNDISTKNITPTSRQA